MIYLKSRFEIENKKLTPSRLRSLDSDIRNNFVLKSQYVKKVGKMTFIGESRYYKVGYFKDKEYTRVIIEVKNDAPDHTYQRIEMCLEMLEDVLKFY